MRRRPTRAAHDSKASTRSAHGSPPFAASCPAARPAPIAPARPATRGRRRLESACATVPAWRCEVQRFLYTDFVLTRLEERSLAERALERRGHTLFRELALAAQKVDDACKIWLAECDVVTV